MSSMAGRVVVVTGAASGIGLAAVRAFAGAGATVEGWDIDAQGAELARLVLAGDGLTATFSRVDVALPGEVTLAAKAVLERHGRVDVLVNNAGLHRGEQRAALLGEETLRAMLAVNLEGTVNCVRSLSPSMVAARSGVILNSASVLARSPVAGTGAYAASKAAVVAFTQAWARELGPSGIRVNAVAAGFVDTAMNAGIQGQARQVLVASTALRRMGSPDEVASVLVFLASDAAAYITGAVIPVDGGLVV